MTARFTHGRFLTLVIGSLVLCGLLGACASSRLLKKPLPTTAADLGWAASAPEGLTVEVDQLISRNGDGSWVRDANWDEYVLTVKNDSQAPFEIQRFDLYSEKLPAPEESSTSRDELEARTSRSLRALKDVGIVAGAGIVVPGALILSAVGTSGGFMSASAGAEAVAAAGVVAIPVGLIGGTVYVIKRRHRAKEDKALIEQVLIERGFSVPLQIAPGRQLRRSAFFPVTPAPTRLVVHYAAGGDSREVSVDLPALAGLHLTAPHSTNVSHDSPRAIH
jgi:hypothetical protein